MRKSVFVCAILFAALLGAASCEKLHTDADFRGDVAAEASRFGDAIPAEYGTLVGVTSSAQRPTQAQLWFQGTDGGIVIVFVDMGQRRIGKEVLRIPRR